LRCIDLVLFSSCCCLSCPHPLRSNVHAGKGVKEPENIQEPQNYGNDHDAVQNGLDGPLHGNEAIHQPQEDTHHDQNFQQLN
jgi:hypothetical protein